MNRRHEAQIWHKSATSSLTIQAGKPKHRGCVQSHHDRVVCPARFVFNDGYLQGDHGTANTARIQDI